MTIWLLRDAGNWAQELTPESIKRLKNKKNRVWLSKKGYLCTQSWVLAQSNNIIVKANCFCQVQITSFSKITEAKILGLTSSQVDKTFKEVLECCQTPPWDKVIDTKSVGGGREMGLTSGLRRSWVPSMWIMRY